MSLSAKEQIELGCGDYRARLAPAAGGRLTRLSWQSAGAIHDLLVPLGSVAFGQHDWPKAGAFPMAPYANRLPGARFTYQSRVRSLAPSPHGNFSLHGFAHRRVWTLLDVTTARATIEYSQSAGDEGWEWPFTVQQTVQAFDHGVSVTLSLTNRAEEPMPAGIGWHPYHPVQNDEVEVPVQALRQVDLDADGRATLDDQVGSMPSAHRRTWAAPKGETVAYSGWDGRAVIPIAEAVEAVIEVRGCENLVTHRPADTAYVCVEPILLLPGTVGDQALHAEGLGLLAPGQDMAITWLCSARAVLPRS